MNLTRNKVYFTVLLSIIVMSVLNQVVKCDNSDLPPPPEKPERFTSRQQLKEYLIKLHEYYAIIGRPRFGRSQHHQFTNKQSERAFMSQSYDNYEDSSMEQAFISALRSKVEDIKVGNKKDNHNYFIDIFG